jgi:N-acetylglucosamine kinase-like BadF-type ATPase
MILIVDSGGTKTDWGLVSDNLQIKTYATEGLNTCWNNRTDFDRSINSILSRTEKNVIKEVHYYLAGFDPNNPKLSIIKDLKQHFPNAYITVQSDVQGAGISLFGNECGTVGLLGTGSGWAFYDGTGIQKRVAGLGYILGDEGGGVDLGRALLTAYCRHTIPSHLSNKISLEYGKPERLLHDLYSISNPRPYLAKFSKFINSNLNDPYIFELVYERFKNYVRLVVENFPDYKKYPMGFVGSISHEYQIVLRAVLSDIGIARPITLKSPINHLIKYHCSNESIVKYY